FEDYQTRQEARAAAAVREARSAGVRDSAELFLVGSRAYLRGCWDERELARMFLAGGGPPGFELIARRRYREWSRVNAALLHPELGEHIADVVLHGLLREEHALADLPVGQALADQLEDAAFLVGEAAQRVGDRRLVAQALHDHRRRPRVEQRAAAGDGAHRPE